MSFPINFYYNQSDYRVIKKNLTPGKTFNGVLRETSDIINPVIMFDNAEVMKYNYCYIPAFSRYYTVSAVENIRENLWAVSMECDVLMSFKRDILQTGAVVDKQSEDSVGDEYIDDGSLVCENLTFSNVYNFPVGLPNVGQFILITAG